MLSFKLGGLQQYISTRENGCAHEYRWRLRRVGISSLEVPQLNAEFVRGPLTPKPEISTPKLYKTVQKKSLGSIDLFFPWFRWCGIWWDPHVSVLSSPLFFFFFLLLFSLSYLLLFSSPPRAWEAGRRGDGWQSRHAMMGERRGRQGRCCRSEWGEVTALGASRVA